MSGKQARWRRFNVIEALDFRHRLGYPADCHRIDPRSFERLRGEGARTVAIRDTASAVPVSPPAATRAPSPSPHNRSTELGDVRLSAGDVAEAA